MKQKTLITVHSQKGGVGKTLISLYLARRLAEETTPGKTNDSLQTVLIDADLTGTSLVDYLNFCARRNDGSIYTIDDTKEYIKERGEKKDKNISFLNDYLECIPPTYTTMIKSGSLHPYLWKSDTTVFSNKLSLIPSSGTVVDVNRILPALFREDITGYFRHRLTDLCMTLWKKQEKDEENEVIIIDTPPVLHGISEVILKLHQELDETSQFEIKHYCLFVCGPDIQGIAGTFRNIDNFLHLADELKKKSENSDILNLNTEWIKFIINLLPEGELKGGGFIAQHSPKTKKYLANKISKVVKLKILSDPHDLLKHEKSILIDYKDELSKFFLDYFYLTSDIKSLNSIVTEIKNLKNK